MRKSSRAASAAYAAMCVLVALYGAAILMFMRKSVYQLPVFLLISGAAVLALAVLSRKEKPLGIVLPEQAEPLNPRVFFAAAGLSLLVSLVYQFAFFPCGFSTDTAYQWQQLNGEMPLTDWHPALHTMLLWLCTRIVDHPAFALLVQSVLYASAVGYAAASMRSWRVPTPAVALTVLYLSANPGISNIMAFLWKDCALAVAVLFLAVQLFHIHCSQGAWLAKKGRPLLLALTLALCAILRHNGIALSLAAGVWLLISVPGLKKRALMAVLCAAALFALIKGPLYDAADVQKNATTLDETIGLPMVVLAHIYAEAPESLDAETTAFLELLGPREVYAEHYIVGDWNTAKWNLNALPEDHGYSTLQVFTFAVKAAIKESTLALRALCSLFGMPLLPTGDAYWRMTPYTDAAASQYIIDTGLSNFLSRALNWLCRMTAKPALSWLFWLPGVPLMLVMAACVLFARRRPLTALLIPAALIAYHLATTVVLSSPTDFRFFLPTLIGAPLALAALFMRPCAQNR